MKNKVLTKIARLFSRQRFLASVVAAPLLAFGPSPVAAAPARRVLESRVRKVVANLQPIALLAATNQLRLAIGLPLHNQAALTSLLQRIYDPASLEYRHYLTSEEFTAQFGPSEQDYQAVIAFAKANGLTVTGTHTSRMVLDVSGNVAQIEKAFQVTMRLYHHPTENRTFFAPDVAPSVPAGVPILSVGGLNNYIVPHPMDLKITPLGTTNATPSDGSGPGGTYMGHDFRQAYAPGVSLDGSGQKVGLLQFDSGFYQSDITAYEIQAGLPTGIPVVPILLDGYNGGPGIGNDEVSLDIEMTISMAPGISGVYVFEGSLTDDILDAMASRSDIKQLSASWGYPIDATSDAIFLRFAAQGQSFFNASGDSDAFLDGQAPSPGGDPNITVVGGTTLTTGVDGSYKSETVWNLRIPNLNAGGDWGSSGGISGTPIPTWQQGIDMSANQGSTIFRNLPDVALTADNVFLIYGGGLSGASGGTSAASPLWAGFVALVNQHAVTSGRPTVGFINPTVYAIGQGPNYALDFHDTTSGDNTWPGSPTKYFAVPGYDLCTGWGTPNGAHLINDLAAGPAPSGLLQLSVNPPTGSPLSVSSAQPIYVTVTDGSEITNATVTAVVAGVTNLTFLDDGQPPDVQATDGVYSATLQIPASTGGITMTVVANATNEIGATNVIQYTIVPRPPNDNFVNAIKIPAGGASYLSNNRFATLEPGETTNFGVGSLWWSWTAPANTNVFVDTTGSAVDTELTIYSGLTVSNLAPLITVNDVGSSKQAYLNFDAAVGKTYRIGVTSANTNSMGPLRLAVVPGGQRDTNAPVLLVTSPLNGAWVSNRVTTILGTVGDPPPNASGVKQVVLTVNGVYQFIAAGTTNWSGIVALQPGMNNLAAIAQDFAGNVSPPVLMQLDYVPPPNPPNDLFANALPLTTTPEEVMVSTTNATKEYGEPDHAGNRGGKSVWWYYQPPANGVLVLNTTNSTFDTLLALYTGTNIANLTTIAANDDAYDGAPGGFSLIEQAVRSNQVYHIAVDGYGGASGTAVLHYAFTPATIYHLTTSNSAGGVVLVTAANSLGGDAVIPGNAGDFASNATVVLTAIPHAYSQFDRWDGSLVSSNNPLSLVMTGNMSLTGHFDAANYSDDFESGGLTKLQWATGGNAPWFVQTNVVASGRYAVRSGIIGDNQSSSLFYTTNFFPGTVSFDYKVSSETNFDWFGFYVDGVLIHQWSGEVGWANFTFPLSAGDHTLEWRYTKDPNLSAGLDAAFIDNVNLPLVAPKVIGGPAYLQLVQQGNGAYAVNLKGSAYAHYVLQVSTNLIDWQDLSTNTATGNFILIPDPASVSNSIRFYRAVGAP